MAGLMNNGAPPQGGPPPAAGAPQGQPPADNSNVSPEEQAQYDSFVTNAMSLMNDEKGVQNLLKSIEGDGDPIKGLANAVASIVMRVEDSAVKAGEEISGDVLMHGGAEILEQAADLSEQVGGHAFTPEEMESATYMAMDLYRESRGDKIDQGEQGESMQELQAAEADGSLEKQIPGITEHSQKPGQAPAGGPPPGEPQQRGLMG